MIKHAFTALAGVVLFLGTSPSFAQSDFGAELPLQETRSGRLSAAGTYSMTSTRYVWHLQFQTRLLNSDIEVYPETIYWNFWSVAKGGYLGPWNAAGRHTLRNGYFFEHSRRMLYQLLPEMPGIKMVFAVKGFSDFDPIFHIPLNQLCGSREGDYITEMWGDDDSSCAHIEVEHLPNSPTRCVDYREDLDLYIQRGYMDCEEAKELDHFQGCDLALGFDYQCD